MTAMTTEHSSFPSDETLAAFIDGTLDEATRKRVMEHLAACAECLDIVLDSSDVKAENESNVVRPSQWTRNFAAGLAAAAVLVVVAVSVWPRDPISKLAKAAPPLRYGSGRLAGFRYAPQAAAYRTGEPEDVTMKPEYLPFEEAAVNVEAQAAEHPNARTLHAKGVALLVLHKPGFAVKAFNGALQYEKGRSADPRLLSDLAAAYIASGQYAEALNAAERAWNLSKTPEAAWNRAMAAQRLERRDQAITYWHEYLTLDPDSPWSAEARGHLDDLK